MLRENPSVSYAGRLPEADIPRIASIEDFEAVTGNQHVTPVWAELVETGVYGLKPWVDPYSITKARSSSGHLYSTGRKAPEAGSGSREISLKNGESLYTEYAYDNDKNLSFLKTHLGSETLAENHYRYDGNGSRTEKRQMNGMTLYHYDSQNRLRMEYPGRPGKVRIRRLQPHDQDGNL